MLRNERDDNDQYLQADAAGEERQSASRGQAVLLANLVEFAQVLNGPWWSESVVHYCRRIVDRALRIVSAV